MTIFRPHKTLRSTLIHACEGEEPDGEEEECCLRSALPRLPARIHWRDEKNREEENDRTLVYIL